MAAAGERLPAGMGRCPGPGPAAFGRSFPDVAAPSAVLPLRRRSMSLHLSPLTLSIAALLAMTVAAQAAGVPDLTRAASPPSLEPCCIVYHPPGQRIPPPPLLPPPPQPRPACCVVFHEAPQWLPLRHRRQPAQGTRRAP